MTLPHIRALAEEYGLKYNPDRLAPFPHEHVLKAHKDLRIYVTHLDDDDVSGVILFKDDRYSILINNSKPSTRQNFTLGHELGHYFLHKETLHSQQGIIDGNDFLDGPKILYRSDAPSADRQTEIEANHFAASLIMPNDLVRKAWEATGDIEACARIFNVSVIAMSIRLTQMGIIED